MSGRKEKAKRQRLRRLAKEHSDHVDALVQEQFAKMIPVERMSMDTKNGRTSLYVDGNLVGAVETYEDDTHRVIRPEHG